jgi:hypothetical protein
MNAFRFVCIGALASWFAFVTIGADAESLQKETHVYSVTTRIVSYLPGDIIASYNSPGSSNTGVGGTASVGVSIDGTNYRVTTTPKQRDGAPLIEVETSVGDQKSKVSEYDFSDMKPRTVDLGVAKDGRRYHVNLTPQVWKSDFNPRSLADESDIFSTWQFREAPVIVNDANYVGRLGGGGDIASFEISDIGSIEITLHEMEGWHPWGMLKDGVITIIRPEDRMGIEILNAQNGPSSAPLTLPGGPYRVWVRWEEAMKSEEVWKIARANRETMIKNGLDPNDIRISYIDKQLAREPGPWIVNSGFHGRGLSRPVEK